MSLLWENLQLKNTYVTQMSRLQKANCDFQENKKKKIKKRKNLKIFLDI